MASKPMIGSQSAKVAAQLPAGNPKVATAYSPDLSFDLWMLGLNQAARV